MILLHVCKEERNKCASVQINKVRGANKLSRIVDYRSYTEWDAKTLHVSMIQYWTTE